MVERGHFIIDLTYLRDTGHARAVRQSNDGPGKPHFVVTYHLVLQVVGRNLFWHARLPSNQQALAGSEGQMSIAASFVPGTR
jgi:hypothetical protein